MEAIACSECGCALPKAGYGSSAWKKRTLAGGIVCKHCSTAKVNIPPSIPSPSHLHAHAPVRFIWRYRDCPLVRWYIVGWGS